jgi:hypothetical protein
VASYGPHTRDPYRGAGETQYALSAAQPFHNAITEPLLDENGAKGGAHCFNLVKLAINDRTHVVPPSFEYDSSYWCESGLMSDHTALTRIALSFKVS